MIKQFAAVSALFWLFVSIVSTIANGRPSVVVIDPGHGGSIEEASPA
jgi:hypothetical protein